MLPSIQTHNYTHMMTQLYKHSNIDTNTNSQLYPYRRIFGDIKISLGQIKAEKIEKTKIIFDKHNDTHNDKHNDTRSSTHILTHTDSHTDKCASTRSETHILTYTLPHILPHVHKHTMTHAQTQIL